MRLFLLLAAATVVLGTLALAAGHVANWQGRRHRFLWGFLWGLATAVGPVLACARGQGWAFWLAGLVPEWFSPLAFLAGGLGFPVVLAYGQPQPLRTWLFAQLILLPAAVPAAFLLAIMGLCSFT